MVDDDGQVSLTDGGIQADVAIVAGDLPGSAAAEWDQPETISSLHEIAT